MMIDETKRTQSADLTYSVTDGAIDSPCFEFCTDIWTVSSGTLKIAKPNRPLSA